MVKPGNRRTPATREQYRIGITTDLGMDSLWDPEADKYKALCRMVHVTKASLHIGYIQMLISFVFSIFFGYHYFMAISGHLSSDHWINHYTAKYISQLLIAVAIQLILVVLMIHGVRSERRALLLPYIVYATIAILAGCAQLGTDLLNMDRNSFSYGSSEFDKVYNNRFSSQFVSHFIGTMIHAWCLSVVWRCYGFLGEKKVARQISEQLQVTAAFHYPEQLFGWTPMPNPPPYADTVVSRPIIVHTEEDKQPLATS